MRISIAALSTLLTTAIANPPSSDHPTLTPKNTSTSSCPGTLPPSSIYPNLIIPISAAHPTTAYGTVYKPVITPNDFCTIFNLYIPPSAHNKTCTLSFLFPERHQLETSSYSYAGAGHVTFTGYPSGVGATTATTWNTRPAGGGSPPSAPSVIRPGHAYVINRGGCEVREWEYLLVSGMMCSNDTRLEYFQDYNPCPIGLFVTVS
ncbi:MAG: hypothetical protein Q9165_008113 [Trypethelium subeluteriae]